MVEIFIKAKEELKNKDEITVFPEKRIFRDAWMFSGSVIEIDMTVAKEIHKNTLREERTPLLESLDTEWFKAAETSNTSLQESISQQKQILRDITDDPRIESAIDADELESLTLEYLLNN